ncbi:MAG: recombination protein RecR [Alphaproteobacteria bacterium]|nr:recombination protein RecR [Alphaproteobacteria bacterium]
MAAPELEHLIALFSKLPTMGPRSARRAVLFLLNQKEKQFLPLLQAMQTVMEKVNTCSVCGNLDTVIPCSICSDVHRLPHQICVVRDVADLWAIERSKVYKGQYHVLGGVLSALDGIGPEELNIQSLLDKVAVNQGCEIILALPATVEGQTTAHYLYDQLEAYPCTVSALSRGVPVGGELDYLDDGTLQMAFKARRTV